MIKLGKCLCPPTAAGEARHPDGDSITLFERLPFRRVATIQHTITSLRMNAGDGDVEVEEILAALTEGYLKWGIEAWTLVNENGEPMAITAATVERYLLVDLEAASVVGDIADERFSGVVLFPLLKRASSSSPATPTPGSTSAPTGSPESPAEPTPLRPSSTTPIPTDDTGTTSSSPDGDSSSSPRSESVA